MRLCVVSVPNRPDNPRLGVVGPDDLILDANEAHATALAGHMDVKRAYEIADALVPPDLYGFVRNGRHGWRALDLALRFLGPAAGDPELRSPRDNRVVMRRWETELRGLLGREHDIIDLYSREKPARTPIGYGDGDDRVTRASYAFGGVDDAEYAALVGMPAEGIDDLDAWDHLAGYMTLTAATRWQALYLHSVDELDPRDDADVYCELAEAVGKVSREYGLATGDIIRTGTRRCGPVVDLRRDVVPFVNATILDDPMPDDSFLERLLSHADG